MEKVLAPDASGLPVGYAVTEIFVQTYAEITTSATLAITDETKLIGANSASAVTITVPTNASVAFPVGTGVDVCQVGTGQVTFAPAGGVTLYGTPGLKLRAQYSGATLRKIATDTWIIFGDLAT